MYKNSSGDPELFSVVFYTDIQLKTSRLNKAVLFNLNLNSLNRKQY